MNNNNLTESSIFFINGRPVTVFDSSDLLLESTPVVAGRGILAACIILTDGTNDVVVTVYDNATEASGKILYKLSILGTDRTGGIAHLPVVFDNGVYVDINGTNGSAIVYSVNSR
jgi:hypothetical protein